MKQVRGIWLPDGDTHFEHHLLKGPEYKGAGTYQFKKLQMALAEVTKVGRFGVALDIGAHVGLWARVLKDAFTTTVCYEPLPEHIECLQKNLALQENIIIVPCALGNVSGEVAIDPVKDNSGNAHVVIGLTSLGKSAIEKLDRFIFIQQNRIDFMKLDCEGYEIEVVKGAELTIKRCKPVMVIEQKPGNGSRYGVHDRAAVDLVLTWGAKIAWERAGDYCLTWPK